MGLSEWNGFARVALFMIIGAIVFFGVGAFFSSMYYYADKAKRKDL